MTEDSSSTNMIFVNILENIPIVKAISDQDHPGNINNTTTVKIMNNVRQQKVIKSFLIKNAPNMNVY